jgi:hypothetical protein
LGAKATHHQPKPTNGIVQFDLEPILSIMQYGLCPTPEERETEMSETQTIDAFLALPNEALPGASFVDGDLDHSAAWDALREAVRTRRPLRLISPDGPIRLQADRTEWRAGVIVGR